MGWVQMGIRSLLLQVLLVATTLLPAILSS
jgi:hypothetical protein